jgi:hypothetical protein
MMRMMHLFEHLGSLGNQLSGRISIQQTPDCECCLQVVNHWCSTEERGALQGDCYCTGKSVSLVLASAQCQAATKPRRDL